jgi:hypothetical protein
VERTKLRAAIGVGVILVIAAILLVASRFRDWDRDAVDVVCNQLDFVGKDSTEFTMSFRLTNKGRAAATALVFEITDTGLGGKPVGEPWAYTLTGPFPPRRSVKVIRDVPAPPHWRPKMFSKLVCTLKRVTFDDGSHWEGSRHTPES